MIHSEVPIEEATQKAEELGIMFMETSAKAGHNVKSLFKKIAMSLPGMEKENQSAEAQNNSQLRSLKFPSQYSNGVNRHRCYEDRWERGARSFKLRMLIYSPPHYISYLHYTFSLLHVHQIPSVLSSVLLCVF